MLSPLLLHILDFVIGALPFIILGKALYALHHNTSVPGAVENGNIARLRQMHPKAPQIVELALHHVGSGHRMHTKAQGVQSRRQAADSATLASCVPALKADNCGDLRLEHLNLQLLQAFLVLIQLLLIVLLAQLLVGINFAQNIIFGVGANHCRRSAHRGIDGLFHGLHNGGDDFDFRTAAVVRANQMPGSVHLVGGLQHFFITLQILVIFVAFVNGGAHIPPCLAQGFGIFGDIFLLLVLG